MLQNLRFERNSFKQIEKKLKKKNLANTKRYYKNFIRNYLRLNKKYKFNEQIDKKYIFNQIKILFEKKKIKHSLRLIPFGIKDNINTLNLDTKFGIKIRKKFKSGNDARVVNSIEENGGVIFSKLTCAEFAVHYIDKNKSLNPYNKNHIAGTSSTGSAVSVAVGALPISIGTQTAGSILRPSSYCGVIGFKPTYGAIDRIGVLKTNDLSDTVGIISQDFYGLNKTFNSIIKINRDYPWTSSYKKFFKEYKNKKKIKIAFVDKDFKIFKNFDHETIKQYQKTLSKLRKTSFSISKIQLNQIFNNFHKNFYQVYHNSLYYYLKNINSSFEGLSKNLKCIVDEGKKISYLKKENAIKKINIAKKKFEKKFANYDFIIIPTTAGAAPKLNQNEKDDTCLIWTTFGLPSITIPVYTTKTKKLPFGLQIISKKYNDFSLLNFAEKILKL